MKFLYTYACLILLFSTTGNCGDLPQTNEALRERYETKNNGLTQEDIADFLFEAIRLNDREMIKTIMNPPLQKRMVGDKSNPIPTDESIAKSIKKIEDSASNISLLGIEGYLQAIGEDEKTQEKVSALFVKIAEISGVQHRERYSAEFCTAIFQQSIKPNQTAMNKAFIAFAKKNNLNVCTVLLQEGVKPDQASMKAAFIESAKKYNWDICTIILQQNLDQETINSLFIDLVTKYSPFVRSANESDGDKKKRTDSQQKYKELYTLFLENSTRPDVESIKKTFNLCVQKDLIDTFVLLAREVDQQDIIKALALAGKNGAYSVLQKILKDHSPDEATVSAALTETVNTFTKTSSGHLENRIGICCEFLSQNKVTPPNEESSALAKTKKCRASS
jgi:hypothetical protein